MDNLPAEKQDIVTLTTQDVKAYIAPNATDKEVYMFLNICKAYGLNPFKREVHFVKYGQNPGQVIVGYETYLKRAEATGKLNGWKSWIDGDKAKIIIYRKDWSNPFEFEIDIKEFDKQQALWKTMRSFMAKKVVTAIGMRLCFPEDLGGMPYIPEELGVQHNGDTVEAKEEPVVVSPPQEEPPKKPIKKKSMFELTFDQEALLAQIQGAIRRLAKFRDIDPLEIVKKELKYESTKHIPPDKYAEVSVVLAKMLEEATKDLIKDQFDAEEV